MGKLLLRRFGVPMDLRKYLGVLLLSGSPKSAQFNYLIEKVQNRLTEWQRKLLSRVTKLVLIKAVMSSLSNYVMQSCRLR